MSQQDNFAGGFLLGTFVGGVVGGVLGVLVASRIKTDAAGNEVFPKMEGNPVKKKRQLRQPTEQTIETARRGLEDKIAQLNDAIDDVRQQLSNVNGTTHEDDEQAIVPER